jgi:hypothetical protein
MANKNRSMLAAILLLLLSLPLVGLDNNWQHKKRTQVKQACLSCRKKHQRCDNNRPCSRCNDIGENCQDRPSKRKCKSGSEVHQENPYASLGQPTYNDFLKMQLLKQEIPPDPITTIKVEQDVPQNSNSCCMPKNNYNLKNLYKKFILYKPKENHNHNNDTYNNFVPEKLAEQNTPNVQVASYFDLPPLFLSEWPPDDEWWLFRSEEYASMLAIYESLVPNKENKTIAINNEPLTPYYDDAITANEDQKICLYCLRHNCDSLDCIEMW